MTIDQNMKSYLEIVEKCDSAPYEGTPGYVKVESNYYKFMSHDGVFLGWVLPIVVPHLEGLEEVLLVDDNKKLVQFTSKYKTADERSQIMARIVRRWKEMKTFECLEGWRNELYTIYHPKNQVYFRIERSAACLFGFVTYGVHIIGYVPDTETEEMKIWVPRRSKNKPTNPGKLDNTVAGGIGHPHGAFETAIKECEEEANLKEDYVKENIKPAGVVSYCFRLEDEPMKETGVFQPEVEYIYDLVMKPGVTPEPSDGEVEEFYLWPVSKVKQELFSDDFKYNCALIQIDFFIRHGIIKEDEEPNYLEILNRCHRRLEHPTR